MGGVLGFLWVKPAFGVAGIDCTELAGTGTDISHKHDCGRSRTPALVNIGAHRLFTDGTELMVVDSIPHLFILAAMLHLDAQPIGFTQQRLLGFVQLAGLDAIFDGMNALIVDKLAAGRNLYNWNKAGFFHTSLSFPEQVPHSVVTILYHHHDHYLGGLPLCSPFGLREG